MKLKPLLILAILFVSPYVLSVLVKARNNQGPISIKVSDFTNTKTYGLYTSIINENDNPDIPEELCITIFGKSQFNAILTTVSNRFIAKGTVSNSGILNGNWYCHAKRISECNGEIAYLPITHQIEGKIISSDSKHTNNIVEFTAMQCR